MFATRLKRNTGEYVHVHCSDIRTPEPRHTAAHRGVHMQTAQSVQPCPISCRPFDLIKLTTFLHADWIWGAMIATFFYAWYLEITSYAFHYLQETSFNISRCSTCYHSKTNGCFLSFLIWWLRWLFDNDTDLRSDELSDHYWSVLQSRQKLQCVFLLVITFWSDHSDQNSFPSIEVQQLNMSENCFLEIMRRQTKQTRPFSASVDVQSSRFQ